jgi:hypothetical protein
MIDEIEIHKNFDKREKKIKTMIKLKNIMYEKLELKINKTLTKGKLTKIKKSKLEGLNLKHQ